MSQPVNQEALVSVIVLTHNRYASLQQTVSAILKQTWANFELIILDDASQDNTPKVVRDFPDRRIRYLRNERNQEIAQSRNRAIAAARGKYIFFTDDDCTPDRHWLQEGLKIFQDAGDIWVVQGFVLMDKFQRSRVFRRVRSFNWREDLGNFMCANMAFTKEGLRQLGGFDLRFNRAYEDVDIGLRARKKGKVRFSRKMLVTHRQLPYTPREIITEARRAREQVRIIKYHPQDWDYHCRYSAVCRIGPLKIMHPVQLVYCLLFPGYVAIKFFRGRYYCSPKALKLFPLLCLYILIQRLAIWGSAIREQILVI